MYVRRILTMMCMLLLQTAVHAKDGPKIQDCNDDCPEMVVIPAGTHVLFGDHLNKASVTIDKFELGRTLVTQRQWKALMGSNPSHFSSCGGDCPVEHVSWDDTQTYLKRLSEKTGQHYRLPSEAEWEYACIAQKPSRYCGGKDLDNLAWYNKNSGKTTHPVGTMAPNAFGLYDMSGNVWEWTRDCSQSDCTVGRILRGGSWNDSSWDLHADKRITNDAAGRYLDAGFRVAKSLH